MTTNTRSLIVILISIVFFVGCGYEVSSSKSTAPFKSAKKETRSEVQTNSADAAASGGNSMMKFDSHCRMGQVELTYRLPKGYETVAHEVSLETNSGNIPITIEGHTNSRKKLLSIYIPNDKPDVLSIKIKAEGLSEIFYVVEFYGSCTSESVYDTFDLEPEVV